MATFINREIPAFGNKSLWSPCICCCFACINRHAIWAKRQPHTTVYWQSCEGPGVVLLQQPGCLERLWSLILFLLPGLERPIPGPSRKWKRVCKMGGGVCWSCAELQRAALPKSRTQPIVALFDCWPILLDIPIFLRRTWTDVKKKK